MLTGVEVFEFTDGTVDNNDGDSAGRRPVLLFAAITTCGTRMSMPTRTIHSFGWHEGRDPNAFFSTAIYLSANPDVTAAGVNPLDAFRRQSAGWRAACRRSTSTRRSISPPIRTSRRRMSIRCAHFLQFGAAGRAPAVRADRADRRRTASTTSITCSTIRTSRPRASIRSSTSRPSAGRKGAIRTRCSTPTGISRPTPTWRRRTSTRSTTTTSSAGTRDAIRRSASTRPSYLAAYADVERGARQSAHALPPVRHPRGPFGLRGRRVGITASDKDRLRVRPSTDEHHGRGVGRQHGGRPISR